MKNIYYYFLLLILPLSWSCETKEVFHLPDPDEYDCIYMIQAVDNPRTTQVFMIEDQIQTINYSAYYSGTKAPKDIKVSFKIDPELVSDYNETNGTNYQMMPDGSYELEAEQITIAAGESRTPLLKIKIKTVGYIDPFSPYMIPLVMTTDDVPVNENLNSVYYEIIGTFKPGQVPREEVYANMAEPIELFSYNDKCLWARTADKTIYRYGYDPETRIFSSPTTIPYDKNYLTHIAAGFGNTLQVLNAYATYIPYRIDEGGTMIPGSFIDGSYWLVNGLPDGQFAGFIWTPHPKGSLIKYSTATDKGVALVAMNSDWSLPLGTIVGSLWPTPTRTSLNHSTYKIMFVYGNDLMGIDYNGGLWRHTFSDVSSTFGAAIRVGSGWDDFTHVTPFGTDLLAREADGKVWRYEFNPNGFWALKE